MNKEHKYKDKDEYKDNDKDKDTQRITELLTVCYIFGILMTQAFQEWWWIPPPGQPPQPPQPPQHPIPYLGLKLISPQKNFLWKWSEMARKLERPLLVKDQGSISRTMLGQLDLVFLLAQSERSTVVRLVVSMFMWNLRRSLQLWPSTENNIFLTCSHKSHRSIALSFSAFIACQFVQVGLIEDY